MMCCLLNLTDSRFALMYSHNTLSASVGNCLFFWAKSFRSRYLSGEAVLYFPSFLPITIPLPSGRVGVGVISFRPYGCRSKHAEVCWIP